MSSQTCRTCTHARTSMPRQLQLQKGLLARRGKARCCLANRATAQVGQAFFLEHCKDTADGAPVERWVTQKWPLVAYRGNRSPPRQAH